MSRKLPNAPAGLSPEARRIWGRLHDEYDLTDTAAAQIIEAGLRAFDTMRAGEAAIAAGGIVTTDRYGTAKAHPAVDITRQARAQWLAALRLLGLHEESQS